MTIGGRLHRTWFWYAELGYRLPDEKPRWWPTVLNEWFGERTGFPPMWVWRPYCWLNGHEDDSYGGCVICRAALR